MNSIGYYTRSPAESGAVGGDWVPKHICCNHSWSNSWPWLTELLRTALANRCTKPSCRASIVAFPSAQMLPTVHVLTAPHPTAAKLADREGRVVTSPASDPSDRPMWDSLRPELESVDCRPPR